MNETGEQTPPVTAGAPEEKKARRGNRKAVDKVLTHDDPVRELATLLALMNRISARLSSVCEAASPELSMPDWILLRGIGDHDFLPIGQAQRIVGSSRPRFQQQIAGLQKAGLISVSSTDGKAQISVSQSGSDLLARADKAVLAAISQKGDIPIRSLRAASRGAQRLLKTLIAKNETNEKPASDHDHQ